MSHISNREVLCLQLNSNHKQKIEEKLSTLFHYRLPCPSQTIQGTIPSQPNEVMEHSLDLAKQPIHFHLLYDHLMQQNVVISYCCRHENPKILRIRGLKERKNCFISTNYRLKIRKKNFTLCTN